MIHFFYSKLLVSHFKTNFHDTVEIDFEININEKEGNLTFSN